jgi:hypothetical protein
MEIADVRKRILDTITRAKSAAADRRRRNAEAGPAYDRFLEITAVPVCHQVAAVLKAERYAFLVNTPAGAVRVASEHSPTDFIEIRLDTTAAMPQVMVHVERVRGRETFVEDRPIRPGILVEHLTDQDVLDVLVEAVGVFVEK